MLLIVKEILFVRTIGNVKRTVQRKCVLMLGCKGLNYSKTKLLTWSFSGLQTLTHKMWSISQSTGLSLWNIRKNSTTILKSLERKSFPVNRVKKKLNGDLWVRLESCPRQNIQNTFTNKSKSWELQNKPLICFLLKCKCFDCWSKRWCGHNVIFQLNRKRQLNFLTLRW